MKLWLCHHLHVTPTTTMDILLIDENVNLHAIHKIELGNYLYIVEEA